MTECPCSTIGGRRLRILQRLLCSCSGSFRHILRVTKAPSKQTSSDFGTKAKLSKLQGLIWRSSSSVWKVDLMAAGACFSTSLFARPAWPHSPHSLLIQLHWETTKCSFSKMRSQNWDWKMGGFIWRPMGNLNIFKGIMSVRTSITLLSQSFYVAERSTAAKVNQTIMTRPAPKGIPA